MEAPFRYPIAGLADVQRLLDVVARSRLIVPGSLRLAEGGELLAEQLAAEGRGGDPLPEPLAVEGPGVPAQAGDYRLLLTALWQHPPAASRSRWLRFNATLAGDPGVECSLRIDVPTVGDLPHWVDLEGSHDPAAFARLRSLYASLAREAGLVLLEV